MFNWHPPPIDAVTGRPVYPAVLARPAPAHPGPLMHPGIGEIQPLPPFPAFLTQGKYGRVLRFWMGMNFLLSRDRRGTMRGEVIREFRDRYTLHQGLTLEEITSQARVYHQEMIDNFMKNMIWLVEEWMYNRPQGQIWMVAHEGPIDHYAHWDAHMIPTWDLWFDMQRTTVPLPAEPNAEERAIQDFYRWCLRPANVARVWEEPLRCVNSDELVTWYQNDFVLPALPPGVGPPSMLLLRALRHVTCMMLQPTFIHIRTKLRDLRGKFSFGRNNDWYTALYRFDEYTAACYLDLQVGVLNQFALQRERRQEWSFAEIDEEDALNYTGG